MPTYAFTYFAPRDPLPRWRGDLKAYAGAHAKQTTPDSTHTVASLRELRAWVQARAVEGRKGDAGYIVAGECEGKRQGDCVGPASFALIDYDGAEPDWAALDEYRGFAWTTASHVDGEHPAWRVVIPFTQLVAHGKLRCPFDGGHIRNRSQPAFLPTATSEAGGVDAVQWRTLSGKRRLDARELGATATRTRPARQRVAPGESRPARTASRGAFPFDSPPDLSALAKYVPPAGVDGDRHALARALGGWLARRGYFPSAIADAVREQIPASDPAERAAQAQDAAERVRRGEEAPGWEALSEWAERYAKGPRTLSRLERACRDPREPEGFGGSDGCGSVWSEWWAGVLPEWEARIAASAAERAAHREVTDGTGAAVAAGAEQDGTGLHLHPLTGWPWILQHGDSYWLHRVASAAYSEDIRAGELGPSVARELAGLVSEEGRKLASLASEWIMPIRRTGLRATYTAREHTYDPESRTLTLAALRWAGLTPRKHRHIDRWLRALFGAGYPQAAQWIASLVALDRPAPCLYLPGPKGLGKSLLLDGLARLWSCPTPVDMAEAVSDFNESTGACPLVFTDEGFPERLDFSTFRKMITQHSRRVNAKYRAKYDVEGCARFAIAANNSDVLRYQKIGTLTADDLDAIADRLLVVPCCVEARAELDSWGPGGTDRAASGGEIAEHALWLAQTVALEPTGRMAAKPGGGERVLASVVASRNADVLNRIREAVGAGAMGEKSGVHVPAGQRERPAEEREVWVNVRRLTSTFDGRVRDSQVVECCESFALRSGTFRARIDGENLRWRVLSRLRLDEAFAKLD